ncbi:hypothetical protein B0H11DRAFT_2286961 [Mycena galericulata]|nr:hypothetical protein B0H11DRAFT_2286961 [Mycena galericulata]
MGTICRPPTSLKGRDPARESSFNLRPGPHTAAARRERGGGCRGEDVRQSVQRAVQGGRFDHLGEEVPKEHQLARREARRYNNGATVYMRVKTEPALFLWSALRVASPDVVYRRSGREILYLGLGIVDITSLVVETTMMGYASLP